MLNDYKEITLYELNLIFLESQYKQISFTTYGSYQDRFKIINEYLGNYKVKDIDSKMINNFYHYLKNKRKWDYKEIISEKTIENVFRYLNMILNKAVFWKIIYNNPIDKTLYFNNVNKKNNGFVKKRYELLLDIELKSISAKMNSVYKN